MLIAAPTLVATNAAATSVASASTSALAPDLSTSISIASSTSTPSTAAPPSGASQTSASKYAARAKLRRKIRRHRRRSSSYQKSPTEKELQQERYVTEESDSSDSDEEEDHGHSRSCWGRWLPLQFTTAEWWQRFALLAVILGFVYVSAWLLIDSDTLTDSIQSSPFSSPFASDAAPPLPADIWAAPGQFVPFARAVKEAGFAVQGAIIRGQPLVVAMAKVPPPSQPAERQQQAAPSPAAPAAQFVLNQQRNVVHPPNVHEDDFHENLPTRRRPFKALLDSNANPNFRKQTHGAGGWANGQEQRRSLQTGSRSATVRQDSQAVLADASKLQAAPMPAKNARPSPADASQHAPPLVGDTAAH